MFVSVLIFPLYVFFLIHFDEFALDPLWMLVHTWPHCNEPLWRFNHVLTFRMIFSSNMFQTQVNTVCHWDEISLASASGASEIISTEKKRCKTQYQACVYSVFWGSGMLRVKGYFRCVSTSCETRCSAFMFSFPVCPAAFSSRWVTTSQLPCFLSGWICQLWSNLTFVKSKYPFQTWLIISPTFTRLDLFEFSHYFLHSVAVFAAEMFGLYLSSHEEKYLQRIKSQKV